MHLNTLPLLCRWSRLPLLQWWSAIVVTYRTCYNTVSAGIALCAMPSLAIRGVTHRSLMKVVKTGGQPGQHRLIRTTIWVLVNRWIRKHGSKKWILNNLQYKTRHIQSRSKNLVMYRSLCIGASGSMAFSTGFLGLIAKEFVCFPRDCLGFHWVLQPRHILPNHTYRANFNRLTTVRKVQSCPKPTKSTKPKIIDVTLLKLAIR